MNIIVLTQYSIKFYFVFDNNIMLLMNDDENGIVFIKNNNHENRYQ